MSPLRGLLATVAALAIAAGPAAAQSTIPEGTTTPAATATAPGTTSTAPEITAAQAGDGILLDAADRVELANTLAEATEESGVCFGYEVSVGGSGASDRTEILSNAGPDRSPDPATDCPKGGVELQVSITYTSESSESEDSAGYSIATDVAGLTGTAAKQRVKDLSGVNEGDFTGDKDDLALRNATAVLPLILDGATPAELPPPDPSGTAPSNDHLTGSPASDWIREHGVGIGIAVALLVLALILLVAGLLGRRRGPGRKPPRRPEPSAGPPSSGSTPDPPAAGSSSTTTIP